MSSSDPTSLPGPAPVDRGRAARKVGGGGRGSVEIVPECHAEWRVRSPEGQMPSVALTVGLDHVHLAACFPQPPAQTPPPSAHGTIWHRQ